MVGVSGGKLATNSVNTQMLSPGVITASVEHVENKTQLSQCLHFL